MPFVKNHCPQTPRLFQKRFFTKNAKESRRARRAHPPATPETDTPRDIPPFPPLPRHLRPLLTHGPSTLAACKPNPPPATTSPPPGPGELIRAAYLSGLSAPALAARFGVSVGAVRKRAGREGWTKRAYAQAVDPNGPPPAAPAAAPTPAAPGSAPPADAWGRLNAVLPPHRVSPTGLARRALGDAARALRDGRLDDARRLVSTCQAVVRLEQTIDLQDDWSDDPFEDDARQSLLRTAVFEMAIDLQEKLAAGRPLPEAYATLHESLTAQRARQDAAE